MSLVLEDVEYGKATYNERQSEEEREEDKGVQIEIRHLISYSKHDPLQIQLPGSVQLMTAEVLVISAMVGVSGVTGDPTESVVTDLVTPALTRRLVLIATIVTLGGVGGDIRG